MAKRPTRRSRLARRLASGVVACVLASDLIAATPDAGVETSNAIELMDADSGGGAGGGGETLYLEVVVNGNETHKLVGFYREGDAFSARADTLRQLGFHVPEDAGLRVDLNTLPGVSYHYDESTQRVEITAGADVLDQDRSVLNAQVAAIPRPSASNGLLLNYDLYGTRDDNEKPRALRVRRAARVRRLGRRRHDVALAPRRCEGPGSDVGVRAPRHDMDALVRRLDDRAARRRHDFGQPAVVARDALRWDPDPA